jgi:hypothetical protein
MKIISALTCVAAMGLAGCATTEPNTAMDDSRCQLGPTTLTSVTGVKKEGPVNRLDRAYAYMQLSSSNFRNRSLMVNGPVNNLTEDVLRGCRLKEMDEGGRSGADPAIARVE